MHTSIAFCQNADSSSPRSSDTATDCDLLELWIPRKDTDSGVSSGSPLSHSPAASQSSNSSLSPRQQSPVGWQHSSEADYIWRNFPDDSNALPPPPTITDTAPIWSPHHGSEVCCKLCHVFLHAAVTQRPSKSLDMQDGAMDITMFSNFYEESLYHGFVAVLQSLTK